MTVNAFLASARQTIPTLVAALKNQLQQQPQGPRHLVTKTPGPKVITPRMQQLLIAPVISQIHHASIIDSLDLDPNGPVPPLKLNSKTANLTLNSVLRDAIAVNQIDSATAKVIVTAIQNAHEAQAPTSMRRFEKLKLDLDAAPKIRKFQQAVLRAEENARFQPGNDAFRREVFYDYPMDVMVENSRMRDVLPSNVERKQQLPRTVTPIKQKPQPPKLPEETASQRQDKINENKRKDARRRNEADLKKNAAIINQRIEDAFNQGELEVKRAQNDTRAAANVARIRQANAIAQDESTQEKMAMQLAQSQEDRQVLGAFHKDEIARRDTRLSNERLSRLFGQLINETRRTNEVLAARRRNAEYNTGPITKAQSEQETARLYGRSIDDKGRPLPDYKRGEGQIYAAARAERRENNQTRALDAMQSSYERGQQYSAKQKAATRSRDAGVQLREAVRNEIADQSRKDRLQRDGREARQWAQSEPIYGAYKTAVDIEREKIAQDRAVELENGMFGRQVRVLAKSRNAQAAKAQAAQDADEQLNNVVDFLFKPATPKQRKQYTADEFQPGRGIAGGSGTFFQPTDDIAWTTKPTLVKSGTFLKGLLYKSLHQHEDTAFAKNFKQLDTDQKERYLNGLIQTLYDSTTILAEKAHNQRREDWFTDLLAAAGEQTPQLQLIQGGKSKKKNKESQANQNQVDPQDAAFNIFLRKAANVLNISEKVTTRGPEIGANNSRVTQDVNITATPEELNALRNIHTAVNMLMHQTRLPADAMQTHRRDATHQLTLFMGVTNRLINKPTTREEREERRAA